MSEAEKAALKAIAHYLIDQAEPAIIDAEVAKIKNPAVLAVVKQLESAILPVLIKKEDDAVDAKLS